MMDNNFAGDTSRRHQHERDVMEDRTMKLIEETDAKIRAYEAAMLAPPDAEYISSLSVGSATLRFPHTDRLTKDDLQDIIDWMDLIGRRLKRLKFSKMDAPAPPAELPAVAVPEIDPNDPMFKEPF